jgi:hypothetical protein
MKKSSFFLLRGKDYPLGVLALCLLLVGLALWLCRKKAMSKTGLSTATGHLLGHWPGPLQLESDRKKVLQA